jgi:hypothetical protein
MSNISIWDYFYDSQQKRFLEQIVRAFSGFQYQTGVQNGVLPQTLLVPCHMALTNRQIAAIKANGYENVLNVCPQITVFQSGFRGRREDLQSPTHIDHLQVTEREISNGKYTGKKGNEYSVDRLMPLPATMDIQVDIWTSNQDQKYQLVEQIFTAMFPQFEIQNSDNALDWTASTICFFEDDITWSSRQIPIGTSDEIDICSIKLRIPMWITAPAKVKRITHIEEIIAPVRMPPLTDPLIDPGTNPEKPNSRIGQNFITEIVENIEDPNDGLSLLRISSPGNLWIRVEGSVITLLSDKRQDTLPNGSVPSWLDVFNKYGTFTPTISQIRLSLTGDIEGSFVVGTLQLGSQPNQIIWSIDADTLPRNTLSPIDAYINPMVTSPVKELPPAAAGQRYLIMHDIGGPTVAWGNLRAETNDIIEYNGSSHEWEVVFPSCNIKSNQYVLNAHSGSQYFWNGSEWVYSIDMEYAPGYWKLHM